MEFQIILRGGKGFLAQYFRADTPSGQLPSAFFGLLLQTLYLFIYFFSKRTPRIVLHRFPEPLCQQVYYIRAVSSTRWSMAAIRFARKGQGYFR